ncbi:hypothetical protein [Paenibacillus tengchongensis]|uniref:hypothetical protein n=1 Tax=Paenibacillus tengchongensis TaxID=2608684 RepID=UPI00124D4D6B|nr:hypothetical protein [Paenibacillus tengchongensis]
MTVPNLINEQLIFGEKVVYTGSDGFHYDGKSFVGTHTLCMTSQGRVIVHDTGGMFGSETVRTMNANPGKIRVNFFTNYGMNLTSVDTYPFSFNFTVSIQEFEICLNEMPYDCFLFSENASNEIPVYVDYDDGGTPSYMTMGMTKDQLDLTSEYPLSVHTIPFHRIMEMNGTGPYSAVLKGFLDKDNKQVRSVRLFIPSKGTLAVLMTLWKNTELLSDLTGPILNLYSALFSGVVNGSHIDSQEVTLVHKADGNIAAVDETSWSLLNEFHLNEDDWYYQKEGNRSVVLKQDIPYIIDVKRPDAIAFAERTWVCENRILHNQLGSLYGVYREAAYDGQEVALLVEKPHQMKLIQWDTMQLVSSSAHQPEIIDAGERMFLLHGSEIAMVTWKDRGWISNFGPSAVRKLEDQKIGYTSNEQPYYFTQTELGMTFSQGADTFLHSFKSQAVMDISVSEAVGESSDFARVRIHTAEDSEDSFFMLPVQEVPGIICTTYQQSKAPLVRRIPPAQLYLSWSRQVNDFALYHLFGQLYALQAGIEEIQKNVQNRDECNRRLLNFLYYAVQNQKRRLDQVSIYLPAMLERNSRTILSGANLDRHEQPFRYMQQGFMNISTKMRQTLSEIEGALSPVYRLIIPKGDIEHIIKRREKRGYAQAAMTVGLGTAFTIISAGFPPVTLIMGGMFLGANSFFTAKDARQKAELDSLFDHNSLDFYMTKALDTFHHLMDTLIPYHVSEANRYMTGSFEQLAPLYKSALTNPEAVDLLFKEISQYYTFKQLPIDHTVAMPKKALIEHVQDSSHTAELYIQLFQNEVNYNVSEQAEKSRIGTI